MVGRPAAILQRLAKTPSKKLGQHFLVDQRVVTKMVLAGQLKPSDTVVEIGPGLGALTAALTKIACKVIAIEQDRVLASELRRQQLANLVVIAGDALRIDWTADLKGDYKIVANIPYSLTSPLLRKIFSLSNQPKVVILLVQREMADRLVAKPGSSQRGLLTILVEAHARVRRLCLVKSGSFYPPPRVDSSLIEIIPLPNNQAGRIFWPAVTAGFRHKRQTILNALSRDLGLSKPLLVARLQQLGLEPQQRAEALSFSDWLKLSAVLLVLLAESDRSLS